MLRDRFAKYMLENKLDFLPFNESYELFLSDEKIAETKFSWVYNNEEIDEEKCINNGGKIEELKQEMIDIFGQEEFIVGKGYDEFEEFTVCVCPAPTYIDLIR